MSIEKEREAAFPAGAPLVTSSGAGGAKLMRRDFGERWENLAGSGEFHWFTPNVMTYASGEQSTANLPIDAHTLIALRAPRPLFITSGVGDGVTKLGKGDVIGGVGSTLGGVGKGVGGLLGGIKGYGEDKEK